MGVVVGTAGHIDHGKTTLLRSLTGIDADRLPEERARGMTIDVGYAHLALPDGDVLDFVDVPGHDRLVGNMLVGAGEIDACLLVVAADDGPRAQTLEHLELLDALGIRHGVAVVTKIDLVDTDRVAGVRAAVGALLAATRLSGAPLVEVSSVTGEGLDTLMGELVRLRDRVTTGRWSRSAAFGRLPIDRAFTIRGRGLVVTGTLTGHAPRIGERLRLLPGDREAHVRGIGVHGRQVEQASDHGRVALNLRGLAAADVSRGHVLVSGSRGAIDPTTLADLPVSASDRLLVLLERPATLRDAPRTGPWPPPDRGMARLHLGTDQVDVRVVRSGHEGHALEERRVTALLRLARPVAATPGDRLVLRRPPPAGLLAGGIVLDADPPLGVSRRRITLARVARLAAAIGADDGAAFEDARLDLHGLIVDGAGIRLAAEVARVAVDAAEAAVAAHHATAPAEPGIPSPILRAAIRGAIRRVATLPRDGVEAVAGRVIADAVAAGRLVRAGDRVRLPGHRPAGPDPSLAAAMARLEALLDVSMPPSLAAAADEARCPPEGVRELERSGRIVVLDDGVAWTAARHARLEGTARALATRGPLTPAALRDATGTSRRYVMALLEDLTRRGVLRRTPDGHVPGPRAGG